MIQNYSCLKKQITTFNNINKGHVGQIQKIFSSALFVMLSIRFPGVTRNLFIGRGSKVSGIWFSEDVKVDSSLRKIDRFLEYLRKHLSGCLFISLEIDELDRCFSINYKHQGNLKKLLFFYRGHNLFFCHEISKDKVFKSWSGLSENNFENSFDCFNEVKRRKLENKEYQEALVENISSLLKWESDKLVQKDGKKEKFLKRKIKHIKADLEAVAKWKQLQEWLTKGSEDLSLLPSKTYIQDVRINFKEKSHYKRQNEAFIKVKKLKKAQGILQERLEQSETQLSRNLSVENTLKTVEPIWGKRNVSQKAEEKIKDEYKIIVDDDLQYAIGLSARGNDQLRKWANKDDLWFHVDHSRSAHIIVKGDYLSMMDKVFHKVATLLKASSSLVNDEVDLIYTKVKNIKPVKGSPGKVIYKNEKRIRVVID